MVVHSVFKADLARAAAREDWLQLCLPVGLDSNLVSPAGLAHLVVYQCFETPQIPISMGIEMGHSIKWRLAQSPRIKKAISGRKV